MTLKDMGRVKPQKHKGGSKSIKCKHCKKRVNIVEMEEEGYIYYECGVYVLVCPYCDEEIILK